MAKGADDYWRCVTDILGCADLQVRETKINVPEKANSVTFFVLASNREVGCFFINGSGARMEKVLAMIDALGCRVVIIDKQHKIFE